jgi:RNA polymerase sigma-70 factor (ECF subfamily)
MQAGMTMDLAGALGIRTEDATLVAELKTGSEEAFALLIAQYHQSLYSLIARSIQDPADAADITQEVFIKVFRNIRGFHGEASLRTWLYRIALHEASNQRRWWSRHKKRELTIDSSANETDDESEMPCLSTTLADQRDSPFDCAVRQQLRERMEAALQQLPEAYRTVVILREIEGFSYEEIAEILDVNLGTVKSRLTRGRSALRTVLIEAEAEEARRTSLSDADERYFATARSGR